MTISSGSDMLAIYSKHKFPLLLLVFVVMSKIGDFTRKIQPATP